MGEDEGLLMMHPLLFLFIILFIGCIEELDVVNELKVHVRGVVSEIHGEGTLKISYKKNPPSSL